MNSRTYQFGEFQLESGPPAKFFRVDSISEVRVEVEILRKSDRKLMAFMIEGSFQREERIFTVDELFAAGWGPATKAGNAVDIESNVQTALSRLRRLFPGILPKKMYRLGLKVEDHTKTDDPLILAHRVFIGCAITALIVVLIDTPTRAVLETFNLTATFDTSGIRPHLSRGYGFVLGTFQGVIGALFYSQPIALTLLILWFSVYKFDPWRTRLAEFQSTIAAAIAGTLGGFFISIAALYAQHIDTLHAARWVPLGSDNRWAAFTVVRIAYAMPWFGFWIGVSVTLTLKWILKRRTWLDLLTRIPRITNPKVAGEACLQIIKLGAAWSSAFVLPVMLLSSAAFYLRFRAALRTVEFPFDRIAGESVVIAVGGVAFVVGFLLALVSLTKGVDILGDRKCALVDSKVLPGESS